jgi:non-specific serine/threonine protein kinase
LLLKEGVRLVTLTGPGGVGKTHLALQVAADIADRFDDGACFVDLSPVRDPDLVLLRIAQSIGVEIAGRHSVSEAITAFLSPRQLLLLLDNCEQVLDAASRIAEIIAACPALQVLATSRAPLWIRSEHRLPVPPLDVPASLAGAPDIMLQNESVRLFLERARAVQPQLVPDDGELRAIAEICQRLDGLPLAIELAAGWSARLSPVTLLEHLSDRLRLLRDGPRDLPSRQRTMRDAIAWSYDLLAPEEQALFRRLAVFVDGFDLEAAQAITDAPAIDVVDRIGALVEQNLLHQVEHVGKRERLASLETVREFAWQQVQEQGETEDVRRRHAEYFLDLAERIEAGINYGADMRGCLERLEIEYPNCRAALTFFIHAGSASQELRLAGMLSEFWNFRGQLSEAITALSGAIDRGKDAPAGFRARAMNELAFIYFATGDYEQAEFLSTSAIPLARQDGDVRRLAQALFVLAHVVGIDDSRRDEAISLLLEAVNLVRDHEPPLDIYSSVLATLGWELVKAGERVRGMAIVQQALALFRASGIHLEIGMTLLRIGRLDQQAGETRQAAARYGESLVALRESGVILAAGFALADLAGLVSASGKPYATARLLGMIRAIGERTGGLFDGDSPGLLDRVDRETRSALGRDYLIAIEAGYSLPFAEALAEAIAMAEALATGKSIRPQGKRSPGAPRSSIQLSEREHEILTLLADRYSAQEIADLLFISVRTVENHTASIYNKLGVNSRRAATATAAQQGLL